MEVREINYSKDVPEIVALLRTSLSNKHNSENFLWKHYENPFGKSFGLLALDGEKIVGVRMFMFWKFKNGKNVTTAIRPVDTITHPDYRGKGIFKKLTLEGLERCENEYDFVFNTPNPNSLPGYLKMGWKELQSPPKFRLAPIFPIISKKANSQFLDISEVDIEFISHDRGLINTYINNAYLKWRYKGEAYKIYEFQKRDESFLIIYKKERIKGLKVMVIMEIFGPRKYNSRALSQLAWEEKIFLIYYIENQIEDMNTLFSVDRNRAVVVYREGSIDVNEIFFSAGDVEGRM